MAAVVLIAASAALGAQTFSNLTQIDIPAGQPGTTNGVGSPYPSSIAVSGVSGTITNIRVGLFGLNHTFPDDIDIVLQSPSGAIMLMSDCGGGLDLVGVNLIFDDNAAGQLPDSTQITSGTYQPTDSGTADNLPAAAPQRPFTGTTLMSLAGGTINGTWSLWVADDLAGDSGFMAQGWSIQFVTTNNMIGTFTASNGNPGGAYDYGDIGDFFNDLETNGIGGDVTLEVYSDGGAFTSAPSYSLGQTNDAMSAAPVVNLSRMASLHIIGVSSQRPVISGGGTPDSFSLVAGNGLGLDGCSYVTIEGLEFSGASGAGVFVHDFWSFGDVTNVAIKRCLFHGTTGPGLALYGIYNEMTTTVENNIFYNCRGSGTSWGGWVYGALAYRRASTTTVVRHNTVLHNHATAIGGALTYTGGNPGYGFGDMSYNIFVASAGGARCLDIELAYEPGAAD